MEHGNPAETEPTTTQATTDDRHLNLALGMKPIIFFTSLELTEISPMLEHKTIAAGCLMKQTGRALPYYSPAVTS